MGDECERHRVWLAGQTERECGSAHVRSVAVCGGGGGSGGGRRRSAGVGGRGGDGVPPPESLCMYQ